MFLFFANTFCIFNNQTLFFTDKLIFFTDFLCIPPPIFSTCGLREKFSLFPHHNHLRLTKKFIFFFDMSPDVQLNLHSRYQEHLLFQKYFHSKVFIASKFAIKTPILKTCTVRNIGHISLFIKRYAISHGFKCSNYFRARKDFKIYPINKSFQGVYQ